MNSRRLLALVILSTCALPAGTCRGDERLDRILAAMPPTNSAGRTQACKDAFALPDEVLREAMNGLTASGDGADNPRRYLLTDMSWYVTRPGAGKERDRFALLLAGALDAQTEREPACLLIELLRVARSPAAVPALSRRLAQEDFADPAARALAVIGDRTAASALEDALPSSRSIAVRLAAAQAAGELKKPPVKALRPLLDDENLDVQLAAARALAASADPRVAGPLEAYVLSAVGVRAPEAAATYADFLHNLIAAGHGKEAAKRTRAWLKSGHVASDAASSYAGLALLKDALGRDAVPDLVAALSGGAEVRASALRLLGEFKDDRVSKKLAELLPSAEASARTDIVTVLGQRPDARSRAAVLASMRDTNVVVRAAAIDTATSSSPQEAAPILVELLLTNGHDAQQLEAALLRVPGTNVLALLLRNLRAAPPAAQVTILDVLATRKADADVKEIVALLDADSKEVSAASARALAALAGPGDVAPLLAHWKGMKPGKAESELMKSIASLARDAAPGEGVRLLLEVLPSTSAGQRAALLGALRAVGGADALHAVAAEAASSDATVRRAAVKALSDWPGREALPPLLEISRSASDPAEKVMALRGFLDVVRKADMPSEEKLSRFVEATPLVQRPEEKRLLVSGLAALRTDQALAALEVYLGDPDVCDEAVTAVIDMSQSAGKSHPALGGDAAKQALSRAAAATRNEMLLAQVNALMGKAANLAEHRPVTASVPQQGARAPALAVDGRVDIESCWWGSGWPADLVVDLVQTQKVAAAHVYFYSGDARVYQYRVDVSADGDAWQTVVDRSSDAPPASPEGFLNAFAPVSARYARLSVLKNSVNEAVHVVEFEVLGAQIPAPLPGGAGGGSAK
jgi:HEAT repeat protein